MTGAKSPWRARIVDALLDGGADLIVVVDRDGRCLWGNQRALAALEVDEATLQEREVKLFALDPTQAQQFARAIEETVRSKQTHTSDFAFTHRSRGVFEATFAPVLDVGGEVEAIAVTARDVSGRRQAEERARTILESVTDAFFSLDRNYCFSYLNVTAERLLQRSDLVGKNLWAEFPAARGTEFDRRYTAAMTENVSGEFIEYYPAPLDRWYNVRVFPSAEGISVYFQDITEQRRAEDTYRRNVAQMELVVAGANVGVWYCPLPFDELIWDEKVKEHFHLPPDARVTIDTFYERLHPDDRERTRAAIAKSVEDRTGYDIDYRTVSPDGTDIKWIRAVGRAFYAANGTPMRFDGVTIDVSGRTRAEAAMRESEERFRLATRATNDLIWDWDFRANRVHWNEALQARFGHEESARDSLPEFWINNIHPDDRERVMRDIHAVIDDATREHWEDEYRFRHSDGTYIDVLDRGYVVRDWAGNAIRMIGAMQDLSERKRAERDRERVIEAERAARAELERQSRMKDEFLTTISHELRTPLNSILGWAELTRRRTLTDPDVAKAIDIIARNARAQASIIDELLDMSRMLAGKVRLEVAPVELASLVANAIDIARPGADAKGISLAVDVSTTGDLVVSGDSERLQQVLWNLLTNAIKFTGRGGHVVVGLSRLGRHVDISVTDTGEGIAADFLPHVFDRFRQADGSTTRRHGGVGLGLSIVKQVVELHGGAVRVESEGPGKGATFTVTLPVLVARSDVPPPAPETQPRISDEAMSTTLDGIRVLVVEDEDDARVLVARVLEERRAHVVTASSVHEALALFEAGTFDVLVSDIGMPGEDGYSLIRRIRARGAAGGGTIPAVALTAYSRAEDRARALGEGFTTFLPKPIEPARLVSVIAAARRGAEDERMGEGHPR